MVPNWMRVQGSGACGGPSSHFALCFTCVKPALLPVTLTLFISYSLRELP